MAISAKIWRKWPIFLSQKNFYKEIWSFPPYFQKFQKSKKSDQMYVFSKKSKNRDFAMPRAPALSLQIKIAFHHLKADTQSC